MRASRLALVIFVVVCCLTSCSRPATADRHVVVFAAASLTEAFSEAGRVFEQTHPHTKVVLNFAASQQLRGQLEHGARADVFASANDREMQAALASGLVQPGKSRVFAHNSLVVVVSRKAAVSVTTLADLAQPGLKLDLADESVPVGRYARQALDKMAADPAFGPDFHRRVLANVVSLENNVKAVVSKVRLGEADAGIVYRSDVTPQAAEQLRAISIPASFNVVASYPIAPLAGSAQGELAEQFVRFMLSDRGRDILARHGFASEPVPGY